MNKLVIKDLDRNKSYSHLISTKSIPVYAGDSCSCQYGYNCDEQFDRTKPLYYETVSITDTRTKIQLK